MASLEKIYGTKDQYLELLMWLMSRGKYNILKNFYYFSSPQCMKQKSRYLQFICFS